MITGTLALKVTLTPILIGTASLAGRRWGDTLSGWLVGLPFTSGPVILFLALEHGTQFGAVAADGVLVGTASQVLFAVVFARAARRGWTVAVVAGSAVFAVATALFNQVAIAPPAALILVVICLLSAIALVRQVDAAASEARAPAWDLPVRIAVTTALVLALTGAASALGARLSGLLSPYPLYATVLAVFATRASGAAAGILVMRGLVFGLFGFTAFFFVLAVTLEPLGIAGAFALAIALTLAIQGVTLSVLRRG